MTCQLNEIATEFGCIPNDPIHFAEKFYSVGLGIIGGVALLFIIFGGFRILSSGGDPRLLNDGKSYIFYAIIGLLFAIFGYVFVQVVLVNLLHIPGFS